MGKAPDTKELLSHLKIFENMTSCLRDQLAQVAECIRFKKNDLVIHRGDPARGLYIVVIGQIKISIPSGQREKVIEFIEPGQAFGEAVMFLDHPYLINAQALSDSLLIWIDKHSIEKAMAQDSAFCMHLIKGLSQRFETLLNDIEVVNLQSAIERVVGYLLNQPLDADGAVHLSNKRMIASKLGLTPETFSRALNQLTQSKLISVHGAKLFVFHQLAQMQSIATSVSEEAVQIMEPVQSDSKSVLSGHPMTHRVDRSLYPV